MVLSHARLSCVLLLACTAARSAQAGELDALIVSCAPLVSPVTMGKLVQVESRGHIFAISDNGLANLPWRKRKSMLHSFAPTTMTEAVMIAQRLRDTGHLFDVGLAQVSNRNFARYGLSITQAFDPCTNLRVGSQILTAFYLDAQRTRRNSAEAVLAAISAYNTGNFIDGFNNGYVSKVVSAKFGAVPALARQYDGRLPMRPLEGNADVAANSVSFDGERKYLPEGTRMVRPPEMLSRKIAVLHVSSE